MTETIVMIHGMWGGAWCWERYRPFFEERGYRCHTPTLRHHDTDPAADAHPALGTTSLRDYRDDLERLIAGLDEPPVIMGHSMGGLLAQMLAARGRARALVLVSPAAPAGISALSRSVLKSFRSYILWRGFVPRWGFWKRPYRQTYAESVYASLHKLPPAERDRIFCSFVPESGRAVFEIGLWPIDRARTAAVDTASVTCPVLLVTGSDDRIVPAAITRQIVEKYRPRLDYQEFAGHAHWLLGEPGWEKIAEYIAGWLKAGAGRSGNRSAP